VKTLTLVLMLAVNVAQATDYVVTTESAPGGTFSAPEAHTTFAKIRCAAYAALQLDKDAAARKATVEWCLAKAPDSRMNMSAADIAGVEVKVGADIPGVMLSTRESAPGIHTYKVLAHCAPFSAVELTFKSPSLRSDVDIAMRMLTAEASGVVACAAFDVDVFDLTEHADTVRKNLIGGSLVTVPIASLELRNSAEVAQEAQTYFRLNHGYSDVEDAKVVSQLLSGTFGRTPAPAVERPAAPSAFGSTSAVRSFTFGIGKKPAAGTQRIIPNAFGQ